jgi:hypothetical protein
MAIDYVIDYACQPKDVLSTEGIMERLKGRERAETIIRMFRRNGDDRPPSQMGFEFTRSTPEGTEENRVVVVQDLLDQAAELEPLASFCDGCPANVRERPFGCMSFIQYPISAAAEAWLLNRLPVPDETLVWLLLKQGVEEFNYDGESIKPMREANDTFFEVPVPAKRRLGELSVDANQVFETMFGVGNINPNHAALMLLFFKAIPRDLEANEIMQITPAASDAIQRHPFLLKADPNDDESISEFKRFFYALYTAWRLNVRMIIDA